MRKGYLKWTEIARTENENGVFPCIQRHFSLYQIFVKCQVNKQVITDMPVFLLDTHTKTLCIQNLPFQCMQENRHKDFKENFKCNLQKSLLKNVSYIGIFENWENPNCIFTPNYSH